MCNCKKETKNALEYEEGDARKIHKNKYGYSLALAV